MSAKSSQFLSKNERDLFTVLHRAIEYWNTSTGKAPEHIALSVQQRAVIKKLIKKLKRGPVFDAANVVPVVVPADPPCVLYRGIEITAPQPPRRRYRRDDTRSIFDNG